MLTGIAYEVTPALLVAALSPLRRALVFLALDKTPQPPWHGVWMWVGGVCHTDDFASIVCSFLRSSGRLTARFVSRNCREDHSLLCQGVPFGQVLKCLASQQARLSKDCRNAIARR